LDDGSNCRLKCGKVPSVDDLKQHAADECLTKYQAEPA
jgi:hypothetical protein